MKVIVRTPNHLGDCIMALPAMELLANQSGQYDITLLLPRWAESIYWGIGAPSCLYLEEDALHGAGAIAKQVSLISKTKFDAGILMTPSFSSAAAFLLGRVKHRYGYRGDGRGWLLNHALDANDRMIVHRSIKYVRLMESFLGRKLEFVPPSMKVSYKARRKLDHVLHGSKFEEGYVVIAPQAVAESRRWGTDKYGTLAYRAIREFGRAVILLGTWEEYEAGNRVATSAWWSKMVVNLCGKTDIAAAGAVLSKARLFIGNDSGLAHLAAAIGTPLVVLSGADKPAETSPLSDKKTVIIKDYLDCISCVKNVCPLKGESYMRCMRDITVEEVLAAAMKYFPEYSKPKIGVIGTINRDSIKFADGTVKEGWGGILYNLVTLSYLVGETSRIYPVCKVGEDCYNAIMEILRQLKGVETDYVIKTQERNNHCLLTYRNDGDKSEILQGGVSLLEFGDLRGILDSNFILVNFISGNDIGVEAMKELRKSFNGTIYVDIHSRTLGKRADGSRFLRKPEDWRGIAEVADYLQMNSTELAILTDSYPESRGSVSEIKDGLDRLTNILYPHGTKISKKILVVTEGAKGCYVRFLLFRTGGVLGFPPTRIAEKGDATGCGDCFSAGFIAGLIQGKTLGDCARMGNDAGLRRIDEHSLYGILSSGINRAL